MDEAAKFKHELGEEVSRGDGNGCHDFKNVFAGKFGENVSIFCSNLRLVFCKTIDHDIVFFEKNSNFFADNWQKSQKIGILTSTHGRDLFLKKN
jgi:hypothetical protein